MRNRVAVLAIGVALCAIAYSQQVVSAHAGVVHYVEGRVFVNGQPVEQKFGQFPDLAQGQELRTDEGRAEVLLTPGAFLRVSDHSSVRMISRELSDTRFEVLSGSVMVECDDLPKDNGVTVVYKGQKIRLEKQGLYRLDTEPPRFQVYDGRAVVQTASGQVSLKRGKETNLNGVLVASKFNPKATDSFYAWNTMRSGYIASANISAAQSLASNGTHWSSGWTWDPWYGAFTFVPAAGIGYSPFGWNFWSPGWVLYAPTPLYGGFYGGGYGSGAGLVAGSGRQGTGTGNSTGSGISRTGTPPVGIRPGAGVNGGGIRAPLPGGSAGMRTGGFSGSPTNSGFGGGGSSRGGFSTGGFSGGAHAGGVSAGGAHGGGVSAGGAAHR